MLPSIMKHTPAVCALAKPTTTMRATAFCARIPTCTALRFPCRNWMRQVRIPFVGGRSQSESLIFLLSGMCSRFRFRSDPIRAYMLADTHGAFEFLVGAAKAFAERYGGIDLLVLFLHRLRYSVGKRDCPYHL